MISAAVLIAGLIAGKIALASLTVADIATLAGAGISVAKIVALVGQGVEQGFKRKPVGARGARLSAGAGGSPAQILCFRGAPSAQAARFC